MISDVLNFLRQHWAIMMTVATGAYAVVRLSMDSKYSKKEELASVRQAVQSYDKRIFALENAIANLPSNKDITQLMLGVTELKGDVKKLSAELMAFSRQVELLIEKEVKND